MANVITYGTFDLFVSNDEALNMRAASLGYYVKEPKVEIIDPSKCKRILNRLLHLRLVFGNYMSRVIRVLNDIINGKHKE